MEEVAAIQKPIVETKPYNDERESESKSCPSFSIPPTTLFDTCMAKTGNILRIPLSVGLDGDTGKGHLKVVPVMAPSILRIGEIVPG